MGKYQRFDDMPVAGSGPTFSRVLDLNDRRHAVHSEFRSRWNAQPCAGSRCGASRARTKRTHCWEQRAAVSGSQAMVAVVSDIRRRARRERCARSGIRGNCARIWAWKFA